MAKRRPGAIDLALLMKVKDTILVPTSETTDENEEKAQEENEDKKDEKTEEKVEKKEEKDATEFLSVNWKIVKRESRMIDAFIKKNKGGKNIERGHRDRNTRGGRYNEGQHQGGGGMGLQRQVVSKEQQEMHDKAAEYRNRIVENRNEAKTKNKIKLILNLLSPDNFEKKIRELRDMVFPENKTRAECFEEDIEFDKDKHLLTDENLDEDVLQFVVQNIFKKAQDEKLFCILNGQLCQRIIELEL